MIKHSNYLASVLALTMPIALTSPLHAEQSDADLARELSNPVASLISIPFQFNYDRGFGPLGNGQRANLNIQPVIPFKLNDDWNLISRTIVPLIGQWNLFPGAGRQWGIGDVTQSLFFSPSRPTASGIIWGVGPVFLLPTGSDQLLSAHQWGAGLTGVALTQSNGWTVGLLANHIWSVARTDTIALPISRSFVQPFITYTTSDQWTFGLNTESVYDWTAKQLTMPVNASVSKLVRFGQLPVSLGVGVRYYAVSPSGGPNGWGARATMTFLLPAR